LGDDDIINDDPINLPEVPPLAAVTTSCRPLDGGGRDEDDDIIFVVDDILWQIIAHEGRRRI
jgi:hypothetical protein